MQKREIFAAKQGVFRKLFSGIQKRILWAFVLLPTTATIIGSMIMELDSSKQPVLEQLQSVAVLKKAQTNLWLARLEDNLALTLSGEIHVVLMGKEPKMKV